MFGWRSIAGGKRYAELNPVCGIGHGGGVLRSIALRVMSVEYSVERSRPMETIRIVLDKGRLRATDRAARRTKQNRSALVPEALRGHLKRLEVRASEERDREGYSRQPQTRDESILA